MGPDQHQRLASFHWIRFCTTFTLIEPHSSTKAHPRNLKFWCQWKSSPNQFAKSLNTIILLSCTKNYRIHMLTCWMAFKWFTFSSEASQFYMEVCCLCMFIIPFRTRFNFLHLHKIEPIEVMLPHPWKISLHETNTRQMSVIVFYKFRFFIANEMLSVEQFFGFITAFNWNCMWWEMYHLENLRFYWPLSKVRRAT